MIKNRSWWLGVPVLVYHNGIWQCNVKSSCRSWQISCLYALTVHSKCSGWNQGDSRHLLAIHIYASLFAFLSDLRNVSAYLLWDSKLHCDALWRLVMHRNALSCCDALSCTLDNVSSYLHIVRCCDALWLIVMHCGQCSCTYLQWDAKLHCDASQEEAGGHPSHAGQQWSAQNTIQAQMQIQIQIQHIYPSHAGQQCFAQNTIKEQAIIAHSTLCIAITRFWTIRRGIFSHEVSKTQKLVGLFEFHQSKSLWIIITWQFTTLDWFYKLLLKVFWRFGFMITWKCCYFQTNVWDWSEKFYLKYIAPQLNCCLELCRDLGCQTGKVCVGTELSPQPGREDKKPELWNCLYFGFYISYLYSIIWILYFVFVFYVLYFIYFYFLFHICILCFGFHVSYFIFIFHILDFIFHICIPYIWFCISYSCSIFWISYFNS